MTNSFIDEYEPTPAELMMSRAIYDLVETMLSGKLAGLAICATDNNGEDAFFYINKPEHPVLEGTLSKLIGLYSINQKMGRLTTAPSTNRSFRSH